MLRSSRYNIFVPYKGNYLLFNTRTSALAVVDPPMKEALESFTNDIAPDEVEIMKESGFLTESTVDEICRVRHRHFNFIVNNFSNLLELTLVMTYQCNLACTYCYEKGAGAPQAPMGRDTIEKIKKYMMQQGVGKNISKMLGVLFYGGEPLLNWKGCKKILEFLENCHNTYKNPYETRLVTNGLLLTDEILTEFLEHNLRQVQMTLDGCKKDHDKRRKTPGGEGTYERILDKITHVYEIDPNLLTVRIHVDTTTYENVPALLDDLSERGLRDLFVYFGVIYEFSRGCKTGDSSCIDLENMQRVLPDLWRLARSKGFTIPSRPSTKAVKCMFDLAHAFVIDPFGDFYNCWAAVGRKDLCLGSLDDTGKLTPTSQFYAQLSRDPTRFEPCRDCTMLPICMGGCAFMAYALHGTFCSAGCGEYRDLIGERLRWYVEREYAESGGE